MNEDLTKELEQLEAKIAEGGLAATDQVKLRQRHAFVATKLADLERLAPYAELDTEALQAQRDAGELEREDKRLELDAAIASRGANSALARKLTTELDEITMREAGLREELSVREMQQANTELALHRARVHAERELRAEDEAALAGLEDWRRGKATETLRSSFDDRLAQRVGLTQERLIAEAEARIGTRLIFGPSGQTGTSRRTATVGDARRSRGRTSR